ncbi:MAG TPA: porin [Gemmataceae bacterium]|nr:porin [Gemmataceae bacterium]
MSLTAKPAMFHWMSLMLGWMLAAWPAIALGQEEAPFPPPTASPQSAPPSLDAYQKLVERLGKMEERVDWVTKQNEDLLRKNKLLAEKKQPSSWGVSVNPDSASDSSNRAAGLFPAVGANASSGDPDSASSSSEGAEAPPLQLDAASDDSERRLAPSAGGGSKASGGGDPTNIGRAQEVGNLHLGKVGNLPYSYYDFDDGGFHFGTKDEEFSFGLRGMTQVDAKDYSRPTPGPVTSSGFYNPRSRFYLEGIATKPISWEFSFQNTYDTVGLLDAYFNFNYDPRFQVRIGRYKAPFGYEWYRVHIWDLMAPERSLWSNNYEANRRFGAMLWGVLADQRVEYALGSFDSQRNSYRPFNSRQDFLGFVNFKPFYPTAEGFLLRNLQFGGSVDLGNENQSLLPATLTTNAPPGPGAFNADSAAAAAALPFLAFNPTVIEKGTRDLWEAHLAYFYGGLSLLSAIEGGHESYAASGTAPYVHVPINGWFVQGAYIITGETIRDRTLLQPLHPFDLRKGRFGWGAWEVTSRFSQLQLGSQVFTDGLADPHLWSNRAQMVDVGANWYLNQFVKVYFDWEHAFFGSPVTATGGAFRTSNDLFWLRTQVYF